MSHDISVIIPTYNRAEVLAMTLKSMAAMEKRDLSVEFVIVDNGSTDRTKSVVESFSTQLTIRYLFEAKQGKNRALNCALEKADLGNIVVFTDDDVDVSPDWLVSIHSVCERWPDHSVFGGRINVVFPVEQVPKWAFDPDISALAFAHHSYSKEERVYESPEVPFGPNYWVRREVFDSGRRFDEAIGPHPTNRITGDDTSFLLALLKDGYEIVYSPTAIVDHRIQPEVLKFSAVCLRAYRWGRGKLHIYGLPQQTLLKRYPGPWWVYRCGAITWNMFKVLCSIVFSSNGKRLANCAESIVNLAYQIEAIRLAKAFREDARF